MDRRRRDDKRTKEDDDSDVYVLHRATEINSTLCSDLSNVKWPDSDEENEEALIERRRQQRTRLLEKLENEVSQDAETLRAAASR